MPSLPPLIVRAAQVDALRKELLDRFVAKMMTHAQTFFPSQCAALGEAGTERRIRDAIDEGAKHGFVTQRNVCKLVNVAFELGMGALREPWATAILADASTSPAIRLLRLRGDPAAKSGRKEQADV
jgi:hypothetical protein